MVTNSVLARVLWLKAEPANPLPADEHLARRVQRGHTADLAVLVERHHSPLLGFLYRLTGGDRALAEDLTQEAFLRALRSIQQYQPMRPFKPWLYAIAVNVARDHFKRAEVRYAVTLADDDLLALPDPIGLEETIEIDGPRIAAALSGLTVQQREAIILRYYQDLLRTDKTSFTELPPQHRVHFGGAAPPRHRVH
jgi:RNA polymerase sigma-70 factor, ECF subfamily